MIGVSVSSLCLVMVVSSALLLGELLLLLWMFHGWALGPVKRRGARNIQGNALIHKVCYIYNSATTRSLLSKALTLNLIEQPQQRQEPNAKVSEERGVIGER